MSIREKHLFHDIIPYFKFLSNDIFLNKIKRMNNTD